MAQTNILLPEQERVAVGVGGQALSAVVAADRPHALDGLHKLRRLPEPVEVERELCVFDGLSSRDWRERQREGGQFVGCEKKGQKLIFFLAVITTSYLLDPKQHLMRIFQIAALEAEATQPCETMKFQFRETDY